MIAQIVLPTKVQPLFSPKRYKVLFGGRGASKSWTVACALLIKGAQKPLRILCTREYQNSIADSVHKLLSDIINKNKLDDFYTIQNNTITGSNGTEFIFAGLRHNIQSIKSLEGVNLVWIEEAQTVSKSSWDILIPTIREEGSEIWITFNPELETDETYQRFIVHPPKDSIVIEMSYKDNPWFPAVLEQERLELKEKDLAAYLNVWEGKCKQAVEGAIYAKQLQEAELANRIRSVPYDSSSLVHTFWDIGRSDLTAIWFVQRAGMEFHVIDYYENNLEDDVAFYVKVLKDKPYVYGDDWLPHDAKAKRLGTRMSVEEQLRSLGRKVYITPSISRYDGIMAARTIFNRCYFDRENCADGLNALRHYQWGVNTETGQRSKEPLHNWASNGADAWRYFAVSSKIGVREQDKDRSKPLTKSLSRIGGY
jgi:phage terminase large subunit